MSIDETNPPGGPGGHLPTDPPGSTGSVGALIRMAADEELTDAQVAEFERLCVQHDCTRDRVRFEQTLRACCGRVMTTPACTESLRLKIKAMADREWDQAPDNSHHEPEKPSAAGLFLSSDGQSRVRPYFRSRSGGLAAAAVLLLSVAGVLIWQSLSLPSATPPASWTTEQASYGEQIAGFVTTEHSRSGQNGGVADADLVIHDLEKARAHFEQAFGVSGMNLQPRSNEVKFWGGGDCRLPGADESAHLRFHAVSPEGRAVRLSLFMAPDTQRLPMQEGVTYALGSKVCDNAGVTLFAWRKNGVMYLLVSEASGEFCAKIRHMLHAPRTLAGF